MPIDDGDEGGERDAEEGGGDGGEDGGGGSSGRRGAAPSSVELLHEISTSGDSELLVIELRSLSKAVVRYLVITP